MYATDDTIILGKIYFSIYVSLLKHSDLSSCFLTSVCSILWSEDICFLLHVSLNK